MINPVVILVNAPTAWSPADHQTCVTCRDAKLLLKC